MRIIRISRSQGIRAHNRARYAPSPDVNSNRREVRSANARVRVRSSAWEGERGAEVEQERVYETRPVALDGPTLNCILTADAITFASASSARFLRQALGGTPLPNRIALCAIGPQAATATRESFGRVDATAVSPSIAALVAAVAEVLR